MSEKGINDLSVLSSFNTAVAQIDDYTGAEGDAIDEAHRRQNLARASLISLLQIIQASKDNQGTTLSPRAEAQYFALNRIFEMLTDKSESDGDSRAKISGWMKNVVLANTA